MNNTILVIDEDRELTALLAQHLEHEGFNVLGVHDGDIGVKKALIMRLAAVILDVTLPKLNGFEVLKTIRKQSLLPILILTARDNEVDRIVGLEIGADDYVPKPCNPITLIARLKAILHRTQQAPMQSPRFVQYPITVDCAKRHATVKGAFLELTNAEFNLLEMLIKSPGQAFSKEELTEYALGKKYTAHDRSVDVHISNLRNKLGSNQAGKPIVKTVRGFGYILNV